MAADVPNRTITLEGSTLTISDDDGHTTTYPWPADKTMLGNALFVDAAITQHEEARPR